jgi:hypothetical protein
MRLNLATHGQFVPSWNNNKEEDKPIVIHYKRIVGEMSGDLLTFQTNGDCKFDHARIMLKCVTEIENLQDAFGKDLEKAEDVLKAVGTQGLVTEVAMHIINDSQVTPADEKKNQDEPPLVQ